MVHIVSPIFAKAWGGTWTGRRARTHWSWTLHPGVRVGPEAAAIRVSIADRGRGMSCQDTGSSSAREAFVIIWTARPYPQRVSGRRVMVARAVVLQSNGEGVRGRMNRPFINSESKIGGAEATRAQQSRPTAPFPNPVVDVVKVGGAEAREGPPCKFGARRSAVGSGPSDTTTSSGAITSTLSSARVLPPPSPHLLHHNDPVHRGQSNDPPKVPATLLTPDTFSNTCRTSDDCPMRTQRPVCSRSCTDRLSDAPVGRMSNASDRAGAVP